MILKHRSLFVWDVKEISFEVPKMDCLSLFENTMLDNWVCLWSQETWEFSLWSQGRIESIVVCDSREFEGL